MKDIEDLLPRVHEVSPNCPEPTAIRHLRDAAIEFCRRTRVWRACDEFPIGGACDEIAVCDGAEVFEITHASVKDSCGSVHDLTPATVDWLDAEQPGWRDEEGIAAYVTQSVPGRVKVTPKPEAGSILRLDLILVPTNEATSIPDVLVGTYGQVMVDGALGRILALPGDLAQPQLAVAHARAFADALGRWGAQIPRGQQRAKRRTKPDTQF